MPTADRDLAHSESRHTWLVVSWWVLFPCFTALTVALTGGRMCGDASDLLPSLTSNPGLAWPVALVYVLAHIWIVAACLLTIARTGELLPRVHQFRSLWRGDATKVFLMAAALIVEYSPTSLWRIIGAAFGCRS
jgi:hypothetical protein